MLIWTHFWCDMARSSAVVVLQAWQVRGSGGVEYSQQMLR